MEDSLHQLLPRAEDNGYYRGKRAMVVTAVLTTLAAVTVAMRLFARIRLVKNTGREDWSILFALVCSCPVDDGDVSNETTPIGSLFCISRPRCSPYVIRSSS